MRLGWGFDKIAAIYPWLPKIVHSFKYILTSFIYLDFIGESKEMYSRLYNCCFIDVIKHFYCWQSIIAKLSFNFNYNLVESWDGYILNFPSHPPTWRSTEWPLLQLLTLTTTSTITSNLTELGTAQPQLVIESFSFKLWNLLKLKYFVTSLFEPCTNLLIVSARNTLFLSLWQCNNDIWRVIHNATHIPGRYFTIRLALSPEYSYDRTVLIIRSGGSATILAGQCSLPIRALWSCFYRLRAVRAGWVLSIITL